MVDIMIFDAPLKKKTVLFTVVVAIFVTMATVVTVYNDNESSDGSTGFTVGNLNYSVISGTDVSVTGAVTTSGTLTIPSSVTYDNTTYTVTSISDSAFYGCSGFTGSLTIPDSVTTIGNYAFQNCSGFTGSLTIGDGVTTIGNYAFDRCTGFTGSLTIPDSVTTIDIYAFYRCTGFTGSLTIPDSVTTISNDAFEYCTGFTGSLTIPDSVTTISRDAFSNCTGFTGSLIIGNGVTTIDKDAFSNCTGFTGSLIIGNGVTTVGMNAFYNCTGFTSITIPSSITVLGYSGYTAFNGITFYAEDGTTMLTQTVTNLCGYTFSGTYDKMVRGAHTVTYNVDGGSILAPVQSAVFEGSTFTVASYSGTKTGYAFSGWNDGTSIYAAGSTYTMGSSNVTLTAVWEGKTTYTIILTASPNNGGSVSGGGTYAEGTSLTITATSNSGYDFVRWSDGNTDATHIVTVNSNMTYVAYFEEDTSSTSNNNILLYVVIGAIIAISSIGVAYFLLKKKH
jgi:hypothetical protein